MNEHIPYRLYFISLALPRMLKPVSYAYCGLISFLILLYHRPQVVWMQLAPPIALFVVFFYKTIFKRDAIVIADCHNSAFRAPFIRMPFAVKLMNGCDLMIVHNYEVESQLESFGLSRKRAAVLSSPPARTKSADSENTIPSAANAKKYLIFPCAYAADEPIIELVNAMSQCPDLDLYLTGNPRKAAARLAKVAVPANVKFTGFVPVEELDRLIRDAYAVVALTTSEDVVLSSAAEGIGHGRPLILADRKAVRELYSKGRVLVEPTDPSSVVAAIRRLAENYPALQNEAVELRADLKALWRRRAQEIFSKFDHLSGILPPPK